MLIHFFLQRVLEIRIKGTDPDSEFLPEEIEDIFDDIVFLLWGEFPECCIKSIPS